MHRFDRHSSSCVRMAVVGIVLGVLCGATLAASAGSARLIERPRTLVAGNRRIYAFALGARQITWSSRTRNRSRSPGCQMYVRSLRSWRTSRAPLPRAGCGVAPPDGLASQAPVLASGVAAWVKGYSYGKNECSWTTRVGTTISALNASSHQVVRLATAAVDPLDLSVSGRRVAWAENIHGRGRIRGLDLRN